MNPTFRVMLFSTILAATMYPGPVVCQILRARIGVTRLECVFCSVELQRHLRQMKGVSGWDTNIEKDYVTVFAAEDSDLSVGDLEKAVEATRLAKRSLRIVVRGSVARIADRWALKTDKDAGTPRYLLAADEELQAFLADADIETHLSDDTVKDKLWRKVVVEGHVEHFTPAGHINHPYTLHVERYCLTPRTLSFEVGDELDLADWRETRNRLIGIEGVFTAWLSADEKHVRVSTCGDTNTENIRRSLLKREGTETAQ